MHPEFRADIHSHTNCSDGSDDPLALVRLAKKIGLQGLSITDHDTFDAYTPALLAEAESLKLSLLPGIEISSELDEISVHILGYNYDFHSQPFKEFLAQIQMSRKTRNLIILQKLAALSMPISEEELNAFAAQRTIGRPHIARLMVQKGYAATIQDAFEQYLREGGLCYASGIKFTPREVIDHIHSAKGKAILAHPHFFRNRALVNKILELPFDGIECYYAKLSKELELPWLKIAKEKGLIATGGSDYHGSYKPHISLGSSWVGKEVFELLRSR